MVEVIIYLGLLLVLLTAVVATLLSIAKTSRELAAWQNLQNEGTAIMDRLAREIRVADSLAGGGTFDSNPGKLVLSTTGLSGGALASTVIGVADEALYLKSGAAATTTLTSRTVIDSLVFRHITNGSVEAVRIELALGTRPGLVDKTIHLYNTIILRSSYVQ